MTTKHGTRRERRSRFTRFAAITIAAVAVLALGAGSASSALFNPTLAISPSSVGFGNQNIGTTSTVRTVTVSNTSWVTTTISSIAVSGTDFKLVSSNCPSLLGGLRTCTVGVTFTPTASGARTGTLKFTDNAGGSPQSITLTGTGVAPTLNAVVSPSSLDYGNQNVGTSSAAKSVTVTNNGIGPLTFGTATVTGSDFTKSATTCGTTLAVGASCTISVVFSPAAAGAKTGTLAIADNAPGSPQNVGLTGTGQGGGVTLSPTSLTFASQTVGTASAAQTVTFKNAGTTGVSVTAVAATGDFTVSAQTCTGATIPAGATCTASVGFKPTAAGTRSGTLSFTDNAPASPQTVALTGAGAAATLTVAASPASLTFAATALGTTTAAQTVTLKNTGSDAVTVSAVAATGDFAVSAQTCTTTTLAAGASCTASVTFKPTAAGSRSGTLSFTDTATASPQSVSLSGTGAAPTLSVSVAPASLTFPGTAVGVASAAQTVTVKNTGTGDVPITSFTLATGADFTLASSTCSATLAVGASCSEDVTFTPASTGARQDTLKANDGAPDSPQSVVLAGTATAPAALSVSPTRGVVAPVVIGSSGTATLTVTNTGSVASGSFGTSISGSGFSISSSNCSGGLAGGATCTVTIAYAPGGAGAGTGTLKVGAQSVPVVGTGLPSTCPNGSTVYTFAHADDSILFQNPDLYADITGGRCIVSIVVTAGDGGSGPVYWTKRELGTQASYAQMAGVANVWTEADAGVAGHPMPEYTLTANPRIQLIFMRLPDGGAGTGFASTGNQSLQQLWNGAISTISSLDPGSVGVASASSSYTKDSLSATLETLIDRMGADHVVTQDFNGPYGDGDHSDHHTVAYFTAAAGALDPTPHTLQGYIDYPIATMPVNLSSTDQTMKQNAWFAYAPFDAGSCLTVTDCQTNGYAAWWGRQYVDTSVQQPVDPVQPTNVAPFAVATASSYSTGQAPERAVDGSADGYPGDYTHEWASAGETTGASITLTWATPQTLASVVLHDRPNASDQITGGTLSFSDGSTVTVGTLPNDGTGLTVTFPQRTVTRVTFTVTSVSATTGAAGLSEFEALTPGNATVSTPPPPSHTNVAPLAAATASSQDTGTGQTADKAIDGSPLGYPSDYTKEWATVGQGAGAWLQLSWTSPQTISTIVLYDRPNLNDQITGGTITFSDGSTLAVPSLPNDGTALTLTLPAPKTITGLKLTVTSVNPDTANVGLAEIETVT